MVKLLVEAGAEREARDGVRDGGGGRMMAMVMCETDVGSWGEGGQEGRTAEEVARGRGWGVVAARLAMAGRVMGGRGEGGEEWGGVELPAGTWPVWAMGKQRE